MFGSPWGAAILLVAIYCAVQAVRDYRRGNHLLAAAGAACAIALLFVPIQGNAIKVDIPGPSSP
jgi:hypothetical protein